MNKLSTAKRATILNMLVEGMSMRAISRITGASINTITKLLSDATDAAVAYHAEKARGIKGFRWLPSYPVRRNMELRLRQAGTVPYAKSPRTMPATPGRSQPWIPKAR